MALGFKQQSEGRGFESQFGLRMFLSLFTPVSGVGGGGWWYKSVMGFAHLREHLGLFE